MKKVCSFVMVMGVSALLLLCGSASAGFQSGADHLLTYQNSDGGWHWQHGTLDEYGVLIDTSPSPTNTVAPIGLGLLNAYRYTGDSAHLTGAIAGANYAMTSAYANGTARLSAQDPYFFLRLSAVTGDSTYADHAADNFFGALEAGTYGAASNVDTAGWISAVETARTGTWINLRPWEFSTVAYTASQLGTANQTDLFENAIIAGLGTLDSSAYYDYLGLAGGLQGLAMLGTDIDPSTSVGTFGTVNSTLELAQLLASGQNADGSWNWSSAVIDPEDEDKSSQVTSFATLALLAAQQAGYGTWDAEISSARNWLWSMQKPDGGFYSWGDRYGENHEVEAEILQAVPEPTSMVMLGLLGAGMAATRLRKRNKKS